MADGDIHQVEFDSPHGLVEYNGCIYVADTNNHAIRVVSRERQGVIRVVFHLFNLVRSDVTPCPHLDRHGPFRQGQDRGSQTLPAAHCFTVGFMHHWITVWVRWFSDRGKLMSKLHILVDHKMVLLISMAGQHQIWIYAFEETHWWNQM